MFVIGFALLQAFSAYISALQVPVSQPPFFTGYAARLTHTSTNANNISFLPVQSSQFHSDTHAHGYDYYSRFVIPESGVYWISMRPDDLRLMYEILLDEEEIGRADRQHVYGPVGFARYLDHGHIIRVVAYGYPPPIVFPAGSNSHFSIALVQRLMHENDLRPLWTGNYVHTGTLDVPRAEFTRRAGITRPNQNLDGDRTNLFYVPTAGIYWASIRLVPDGTVSRGVWTLNVNYYNRVFQAWSKRDGDRFEGAYASRALVLERGDSVTVTANYHGGAGTKDGFTNRSMVSLARISWNPTAAGYSPCSAIIPFADVKLDHGYMQTHNKKTIIIPQNGVYLIGLRNDPELEHGELKSVLKVNVTMPGGETADLFRATGYPPPDLSTPQGIDGVYYLTSGTRVEVCVTEGRRIDTDTMLSVALIVP